MTFIWYLTANWYFLFLKVDRPTYCWFYPIVHFFFHKNLARIVPVRALTWPDWRALDVPSQRVTRGTKRLFTRTELMKCYFIIQLSFIEVNETSKCKCPVCLQRKCKVKDIIYPEMNIIIKVIDIRGVNE